MLRFLVTEGYGVVFGEKPRDAYKDSGVMFRIGVGIIGITFPALLVAAIFNGLHIFVVLWMLIAVGSFAVVSIQTLVKAKKKSQLQR